MPDPKTGDARISGTLASLAGLESALDQEDSETIDLALKSAAFFVHATSDLFRQWTEDFKAHTNELPRFSPEKALEAGGDPNIAYYHSYFKIEDDEALVIELTPPECDFWNFQMGNYWLESLDYRYYPVHLNKLTTKYKDDGSVRIIIAKNNRYTRENRLERVGHPCLFKTISQEIERP